MRKPERRGWVVPDVWVLRLRFAHASRARRARNASEEETPCRPLRRLRSSMHTLSQRRIRHVHPHRPPELPSHRCRGFARRPGDLTFLSRLRPITAEESKLNPNLVRLESGLEPLVTLIEETPREKLMEEIGGRVRK